MSAYVELVKNKHIVLCLSDPATTVVLSKDDADQLLASLERLLDDAKTE